MQVYITTAAEIQDHEALLKHPSTHLQKAYMPFTEQCLDDTLGLGSQSSDSKAGNAKHMANLASLHCMHLPAKATQDVDEVGCGNHADDGSALLIPQWRARHAL